MQHSWFSTNIIDMSLHCIYQTYQIDFRRVDAQNLGNRCRSSWPFFFLLQNKMASLKYRKFKILPTYFSGKLRNKSYFIKSDHNQISVLLFIVHVKVYVHPRVDETIQVCISWNTFGQKQIYNIY